MLVISGDGDWLSRLRRLAQRGGWSFEAHAVVLKSGRLPPTEGAIVVIDRGLAGPTPAKAVTTLRVLYPMAAVALIFDDKDMGPDAMKAVVSCGADEIVSKSWSDDKILSRLAGLRDRALAVHTRISSDGALKAERRAHRALVRARGRWEEAKLDAGGFAILWSLMEREGELVSRAALRDALAAVLGREPEAGTVLRRLAALKKALAHWPGQIKSVRGGFYRLLS